MPPGLVPLFPLPLVASDAHDPLRAYSLCPLLLHAVLAVLLGLPLVKLIVLRALCPPLAIAPPLLAMLVLGHLPLWSLFRTLPSACRQSMTTWLA